ncbi:MAG: heparinase II/III family protein [Dermatophilus congolensis]|nr:heparinase II/III family protein [Dermatophilus congolensis]
MPTPPPSRIAAALVGVALTLTAAAASEAPASARPTYPCADLDLMAAGNPREAVLADKFAYGPYKATTVGDGTGNIDWDTDPYNRVSWRMWLNAFRWLGSIVSAAGDGDVEARDHALAIVADWMRDHPTDWVDNVTARESTMHRTNMILCLREAIDDPGSGRLPTQFAWLDQALETHAEFLAKHYSGHGNHGVNESVGLVGAGVVLDRPDLVEVAVGRLREVLPIAIDSQGANNEQTTGYVLLNYDLWKRASETLAAGQVAPELEAEIDARLYGLATFLAHATNSLGYHHQIGDSERRAFEPYIGTPHEYIATGGTSGRPPEARVAVYDKGYVFGRSGWGLGARPLTQETSYSLRFGPGRAMHGHDDKTSITFVARGRDVLIDPGVGETTRDAWDTFFKGPEAHNALVMDGMTNFATRLDRVNTDTPGADVFRVVDRPACGVLRTRDAVFLSDPDLVLVVDKATSATPRDFRQLWHLPVGEKVSLAGDTQARAVNGTRTTTVVPLRVAGADPQGSLRTVTGATDPVQGWHWRTVFKKDPAPVVWREHRGAGTTLATAVIPSVAGERVQVRADDAPNGGTRWVITVGAQTAVVYRDGNGTLTRTR